MSETALWKLAPGTPEPAELAAAWSRVIASALDAARAGLGLTWITAAQAAPHLACGALVSVLEDWCPPMFGFFLYHPSQRLPSASLKALIDTLRVG